MKKADDGDEDGENGDHNKNDKQKPRTEEKRMVAMHKNKLQTLKTDNDATGTMVLH